MIRAPYVLCCFMLLFCAQAFAQEADAKAIEKTVKTLITSVRYNKHELAANQLAFHAMTRRLMGETYKELSLAQQKELQSGIEVLIRKISFKKGHEMFEHLDAVLYDKPKISANEAHCKTTVVVYRAYKKAEIIIDWVLVKDQNVWKVVDTIMLNESTLEGIREDQIKPLLQESGIDGLFKVLNKKLSEVNKKA